MERTFERYENWEPFSSKFWRFYVIAGPYLGFFSLRVMGLHLRHKNLLELENFQVYCMQSYLKEEENRWMTPENQKHEVYTKKKLSWFFKKSSKIHKNEEGIIVRAKHKEQNEKVLPFEIFRKRRKFKNNSIRAKPYSNYSIVLIPWL